VEGRDGGVRAHRPVQHGPLGPLGGAFAGAGGVWLVALLALAASITSLGNWYAYDDVSLILFNPAAHGVAALGRVWTQPYWPPGVGGLLYRPLASALWALEWVVGHGQPLAFHLVNVALYVALSVAILMLARRLLPTGAALIAAAVFAAHPVHVEVVANCVGQSELVAALSVVLAVLVYLDHRHEARGRWAIALLYAVGILSKEHVVLLPVLLLAVGVTVADGSPEFRRLGGGMLIALAVCLTARYVAIGTLLGDTPDPVFARASVFTRVWTMLGVATQWGRLMVWPAHLSFSYNPPAIPIRRSPDAVVLAGALLVTAAAAVAIAVRHRAPVITLGLVWAGIFLLPVSNVLFVSGVLLTERSLFLPSVGVALAVAGAWAACPRGLRTYAGAAIAALVMIGTWRSAGRQVVWRNDHTLFGRGVIDAPRDYYAHYLWADQLVSEGNSEAGEREARTSIQLSGGFPPALALLADVYAKRGACDQAIPLWRRALGVMPWLVPPRVGLATCLLQTGAYADARAVATEGVAHGELDPALRRVISAADSVVRLQGRS
jgi:hypothetical protein